MQRFTKDKKIDKIIKTMLSLLVAQYEPMKVILFGSHVKGHPDKDSDIDLLIIKETEERFLDRWCTVGSILAGSHPSIPVDTLVLTPEEINKRLSIGDQFIIDILNNGKLIYAA
ncbi:MAG: nucleotidyltransferase domain-containing protein [Chlamydiales bacterium]